MSPIVTAQLLQGQIELAPPELDSPAAIEELAACVDGMCRDTPLLVTPGREPAGNDATCDDPAISAHDSEAWAQHAFAANGFGDVATAAWPTSYEVHQAARAHRAFVLGELVTSAIRAVGAIARRAYAWHQERRQARAVYDMLYRLDDHALRDLGFHRSELTSVAMEAGAADVYDRALTFWTSQGPPS